MLMEVSKELKNIGLKVARAMTHGIFASIIKAVNGTVLGEQEKYSR